jgi:hypothetical protein
MHGLSWTELLVSGLVNARLTLSAVTVMNGAEYT